jgi:hypothetical protein
MYLCPQAAPEGSSSGLWKTFLRGHQLPHCEKHSITSSAGPSIGKRESENLGE